jgi:hypothetical protein
VACLARRRNFSPLRTASADRMQTLKTSRSEGKNILQLQLRHRAALFDFFQVNFVFVPND